MTVIGINDLDAEMVRLILMVTLPLAAVQLILLITALLNLRKKQVRTESKLIWGAIILFVNIIGPVVYFAVGTGMLDREAAELEDARENMEHMADN